MIANNIMQVAGQPAVLVSAKADLGKQQVNSAEEAYFVNLLDTGDTTIRQTADISASITQVSATWTLASYQIGLLDDGEEE